MENETELNTTDVSTTQELIESLNNLVSELKQQKEIDAQEKEQLEYDKVEALKKAEAEKKEALKQAEVEKQESLERYEAMKKTQDDISKKLDTLNDSISNIDSNVSLESLNASIVELKDETVHIKNQQYEGTWLIFFVIIACFAYKSFLEISTRW